MSATTLRKAGRQSQLPRMKERPVRSEIFCELAHHSGRLIGGVSSDLDFSLADLTAGVGMLAAQVTNNITHPANSFNHRAQLMKIAAHVIGWLESLQAASDTDVFTLIHAERERQEKSFRTGKFLFTCASPTADPKRKLRILTEELGEVAKAIDQLEVAESRNSLAIKSWRAELKLELIQVAAVAVAWLESLHAEGGQS
jgi:hypothetical protein